MTRVSQLFRSLSQLYHWVTKSLQMSLSPNPSLNNLQKGHMCLRQLCSALKTLKSKSVTHSLSDWQCHLLSCPGQLKKLAKAHIFGSSISIRYPPGSWEQPLCARCTNCARRRSRKVDEENISGRVVKAPHPIWYKGKTAILLILKDNDFWSK